MFSLVDLLGSINPTTVRHCLIAINNVSKASGNTTSLSDCILRAAEPPSNYSERDRDERVEFLRKTYGISSLELGQRIVGAKTQLVILLLQELASKEATILYYASGALANLIAVEECVQTLTERTQDLPNFVQNLSADDISTVRACAKVVSVLSRSRIPIEKWLALPNLFPQVAGLMRFTETGTTSYCAFIFSSLSRSEEGQQLMVKHKEPVLKCLLQIWTLGYPEAQHFCLESLAAFASVPEGCEYLLAFKKGVSAIVTFLDEQTKAAQFFSDENSLVISVVRSICADAQGCDEVAKNQKVVTNLCLQLEAFAAEVARSFPAQDEIPERADLFLDNQSLSSIPTQATIASIAGPSISLVDIPPLTLLTNTALCLQSLVSLCARQNKLEDSLPSQKTLVTSLLRLITRLPMTLTVEESREQSLRKESLRDALVVLTYLASITSERVVDELLSSPRGVSVLFQLIKTSDLFGARNSVTILSRMAHSRVGLEAMCAEDEVVHLLGRCLAFDDQLSRRAASHILAELSLIPLGEERISQVDTADIIQHSLRALGGEDPETLQNCLLLLSSLAQQEAVTEMLIEEESFLLILSHLESEALLSRNCCRLLGGIGCHELGLAYFAEKHLEVVAKLICLLESPDPDTVFSSLECLSQLSTHPLVQETILASEDGCLCLKILLAPTDTPPSFPQPAFKVIKNLCGSDLDAGSQLEKALARFPDLLITCFRALSYSKTPPKTQNKCCDSNSNKKNIIIRGQPGQPICHPNSSANDHAPRFYQASKPKLPCRPGAVTAFK